MLKVGFAFNFNIQRCEIEVGDEKRIIDEGYKPLLEVFEKNNFKANCFFSGYSSELIGKMDKDFLDRIISLKDKVIKVGTYTYTHPIPQLLTKEEFEKQIVKGMEVDKKILKENTKSFLPPEFAYSKEMAQVLYDNNIEWFIALASQIEKSYKDNNIVEDAYFPCKVKVDDKRSLIAVPAAYELPHVPARFLKLMMKGMLDVDTVINGIVEFHKNHPNSLLLFKRDAETIFIDYFNSGFTKTKKTMNEFLEKLSKLDFVEPVWIEDVIKETKDMEEIALHDYLGNTKIETFTEGEAKEVWDLTVKVRDLLKDNKKISSKELEKAWDHLLLSHNSDGRIGYWFSKWNPGEHKVAPSRRAFCKDNLDEALKILE